MAGKLIFSHALFDYSRIIPSESNKPTDETKPDPTDDDNDETERSRLVQQSACFDSLLLEMFDLDFL